MTFSDRWWGGSYIKVWITDFSKLELKKNLSVEFVDADAQKYSRGAAAAGLAEKILRESDATRIWWLLHTAAVRFLRRTDSRAADLATTTTRIPCFFLFSFHWEKPRYLIFIRFKFFRLELVVHTYPTFITNWFSMHRHDYWKNYVHQ